MVHIWGILSISFVVSHAIATFICMFGLLESKLHPAWGLWLVDDAHTSNLYFNHNLKGRMFEPW